MSNKIFYFTGTGNSQQIAQDISAGIGETELIKINNETKTELLTDDVVGIVFPVYNWNMPLVVEKFIEQLKISTNTYVFVVADCGNFAGRAIDEAQIILNKNGKKLNSGFIIKMPGNYIVMYGAMSENFQKKSFEKEKTKANTIISIIKTREDKPIEKSKAIFDRAFAGKFHDNMVINLNKQDINFNVNGNCTSCGLCEKICPVGNIKMVSGKPDWNHHCEMCVACIQHCPTKSINYATQTINRKRYINPNI